MRYEDAIAQLFSMSSKGIRLGIQRMSDALRFRGAPHEGQIYVQVAGTNGKGSVASMVASVLTQAGYRTGLYTSPHLHRWVERIRVNGEPLDEQEAGERIGEVLAAFQHPAAPEMTFFEVTTLIALEVFRERKCDVAVLETGLGGRLDATTAVESQVGAITRVALDHVHLLGENLEAIAKEKAGIIKPEIPVVVGVRSPSARRVILERADQLEAPVRLIDRDYRTIPGPGQTFAVEVGERRFENLRLALPGAHQQENAACAVTMLLELEARTGLKVSGSIPQGLYETRWAGRIEVIDREPMLVVDAAHNVDGCRALADFVSDQEVTGRRVLVFGVMRDKDMIGMLRTLSPVFDDVLYSPPEMRRAATYSTLNSIRGGERTASLPAAIKRARELAGPEGMIVIAGSIFLVAAARAQLLDLRSDPLIRM